MYLGQVMVHVTEQLCYIFTRNIYSSVICKHCFLQYRHACGMSFEYNINNKGPSTNPRGMPHGIVNMLGQRTYILQTVIFQKDNF